MNLLAQLLHKPLQVYIKTNSGVPTHQYTFEPISDSERRMDLAEPIRLFFENRHYDAIVERGSTARKRKEISAPQAIDRADTD